MANVNNLLREYIGLSEKISRRPLTLDHHALLFEEDHLSLQLGDLFLQHLLSLQLKCSTYNDSMNFNVLKKSISSE